MGTLRNAAAAAGLFALGAWIAGCGSKGGDSNAAVLGLSGSPSDMADAYCTRFASDFCAARSKCCMNLAPDGAFTCEQSISIDCTLTLGTEQHNGWVLSADSIQASLDRLKRASDACSSYRLPADSEAFAPKELAPGASCPGSRGETCPSPQGCVKSKCTDLAAQGDSCASNEACAAGLTCPSTTQKCQPLGKLGEACQVSDNCAGALICAPTDTDALTNDRQCYERRAAGEPCGLKAECATNSCSGTTCDACTDAACGAGGHCSGGACVYVFDQCSADPTYTQR
jgi:hypothetical protein